MKRSKKIGTVTNSPVKKHIYFRERKRDYTLFWSTMARI